MKKGGKSRMLFGKKRGKRPAFAFFFIAFLFFLFASMVAAAIYIAIFIRELPSPNQFNARRVNQSTKIYDREEKVLLYEVHGEEKRTVVPFNEIPDIVKKATLVAEDINFYNQPAFDWKAIIRASLANLRAGHITQGGSTITQQLVKNVFLSPEKTFSRKIKELIIAIELESKYTKDEIFSFYLNQIPYGSNAYGIEAASQTYFNKSSRDITLEEAAILASLPKAPSFYSPWGTHTKELFERKNYILGRMVELGFADKSVVEKAKKVKIEFAPQSIGSIKAPHFSLLVKEYLVNKYGEELAVNGGLKVVTTLNWEFQELAEKSVAEGSKNNEKLYGSKNAALVAQNPKTGQILAMVGSRNYFDQEIDGNFNVATQGLRQPGSALKPFVYLTAFKKGVPPKTVLFDVSTEFDLRNTPETSYRPVNFDGTFRGPVQLEQALGQSLNIPAVKLLYLTGISDSLKTMHDFGITTLKESWRYGLSLVLGGGEVKLTDLVNSYATLSQDGVKHKQQIILKIEDSEENVLEEYADDAKKAEDPQYTRLVTQILSSPELRYPIFRGSLPLTVFQNYEVALKTGTSEDHRDAWSVGYTPFLVVGVWAGNNDNTQMIKQGSSILAAIPIWNAFMKDAIKKYEPETFVRPESVTYSPKPMLNGDYIWKPVIDGKTYPQIHSVLFYINKDDVLGKRPENPEADPQFKNWESSVQAWASQNIQNYYTYNQLVPLDAPYTDIKTTHEEPKITGSNSIIFSNITPENGSFISAPFFINANIKSNTELKRIELYYNRRLINGFDISEISYKYRYYFNLTPEPQNLFELKAKDVLGNSSSASFIVYSK